MTTKNTKTSALQALVLLAPFVALLVCLHLPYNHFPRGEHSTGAGRTRANAKGRKLKKITAFGADPEDRFPLHECEGDCDSSYVSYMSMMAMLLSILFQAFHKLALYFAAMR